LGGDIAGLANQPSRPRHIVGHIEQGVVDDFRIGINTIAMGVRNLANRIRLAAIGMDNLGQDQIPLFAKIINGLAGVSVLHRPGRTFQTGVACRLGQGNKRKQNNPAKQSKSTVRPGTSHVHTP
jgi:hypothetical protein